MTSHRLQTMFPQLALRQNPLVSGIACHSNVVKPGDLFCSLAFDVKQAKRHIQQAIDNGAVAVLAVNEALRDMPSVDGIDDTLVDTIARLAADFYQYPTREMQVFAVTGTNGKTSVAHTISQLLNAVDCSCGVIGTLGAQWQGHTIETGLTTPDPVFMQQLCRQMRDQNVQHVALEASSHALVQGRCDAVDIDVAIMTNVTRDHLDYHGSFDAYLQAKLKLFKQNHLNYAVVRRDDPSVEAFINSVQSTVKVISYSIDSNEADVYLSDITYSPRRVVATLHYNAKQYPFISPLLGAFNIENTLAALSALVVSNPQIGIEVWLEKLVILQPSPGRMQRVPNTLGIDAFVDFAHTPDALNAALTAVKQITDGRVLLVFGCGGNRDKGKRPLMAQVAQTHADLVVVTSDNPRTESVQAIVQGIVTGFDDDACYLVEPDRKQAIEKAVSLAKAGDCILVAGKGHEAYQVVGNTLVGFDDAAELKQALISRDKSR